MNFEKVHLIIGFITFVVFLATGLYMGMNFPVLYEANESIRYLFRANHVYLLFASLLNIAIASQGLPGVPGWRTVVWRIGSWLLLAAPAPLLWAFIAEPPAASPMRPFTLAGVLFCLGGVALRLIGSRSRKA